MRHSRCELLVSFSVFLGKRELRLRTGLRRFKPFMICGRIPEDRRPLPRDSLIRRIARLGQRLHKRGGERKHWVRIILRLITETETPLVEKA